MSALQHVYFFLETASMAPDSGPPSATSDGHLKVTVAPANNKSTTTPDSDPPFSSNDGNLKVTVAPESDYSIAAPAPDSETPPTSMNGALKVTVAPEYNDSATTSDSDPPSASSDGNLKVTVAPEYTNSATISSISLDPESACSSNADTASASTSSNSTPLTPTAPVFEPGAMYNPSAPAFVPSAAQATANRHMKTPMFEMRESPGMGNGLFATRRIPAGTCIIKEKVLLAIDPDDICNAYRMYLKLKPGAKQAYFNLYAHLPSNIDFDQAANVFLLDPKYGGISLDALQMLKSEILQVMGVFSANNFILSDGTQGVFTTCSRINHSCVPNVHHTNNPNIQKETIFAMRDIEAGEELLANYLGASATYQDRQTRREALYYNHGFTCHCPACANPGSDLRRTDLAAVFWGLNAYLDGSGADHFLIPKNQVTALAQAEDGIGLLLAERIFNTELCKAYRMAATLALDMRDYKKALEYAMNEQEVEGNIIGHQVADLFESGIAAKLWVDKVRAASTQAQTKTQKIKKARKTAKRKAHAEAKRAAAAAPQEDTPQEDYPQDD